MQRTPDRRRRVSEYTHVAIDKLGAGLEVLCLSLNRNGLRTAENLNIKLSSGSESMGHHQHVFMWDARPKGIGGVSGLVKSVGQDSSLTVKIRMPDLSEPGLFSQGTLKGDHPLG